MQDPGTAHSAKLYSSWVAMVKEIHLEVIETLIPGTNSNIDNLRQ